MPTNNPRITVTLTPETAAVLKAMSEATEKSQSAIVGELLESTRPVFERVTHAIRAARLIEESARGEVAASLDRAQNRLEGQLRLQMADMDEAYRPLLEEAEAVKRRGVGGGVRTRSARATTPAPGRSTPVPVTRGSGHSTGGRPKGKKGSRRGGV